MRLFAASAAVLLAAWLPQLTPNAYSIDDYILLHGEALPSTLRMYATQGRFGMAALHLLLTSLGISPVHSYTALGLVSIALLAGACVLLARAWDLEGQGALPLFALPLAFIHPYAAETWSFRIGPIYFASAMVLALWGLCLIRRGRERTLLGMALIAASLSVYQVGLNPLLVAIGLGACLDLWRVGPQREAVSAVVKVWLLTLGAVLLAFLAYFALMQLALLLLHLEGEARAQTLAPADVPGRLVQIWKQLERLLGNDHQLGAPLLYAVQLALLALAVGLATLRARVEGARKLALTLLALFASLLAVIGVLAALRLFSPWPRALTALGLFWSGVVALAWLLSGPRLRRALAVLACALALGYVGLDHRAAAEQRRLNTRELLLAARVLERLDDEPGARAVRRIAVMGHEREYPDIQTTSGDLNVSALYIPWSQAALISEVAGRPFGTSTPDDRARAERRCATAPKWPARGAVSVEGDLGIVCF
jgi:hypothetical protein